MGIKNSRIDFYQQQKLRIKKQLEQVKYCLLCGRPVILASSTEDGGPNQNVQWEQEHSTHWACYQKQMTKHRKPYGS